MAAAKTGKDGEVPEAPSVLEGLKQLYHTELKPAEEKYLFPSTCGSCTTPCSGGDAQVQARRPLRGMPVPAT